MPNGLSLEKRTADAIGAAVAIGKIAISKIKDEREDIASIVEKGSGS